MKDEISEICTDCGAKKLIAYWDYELEFYIYLRDKMTCEHCEIEREDCIAVSS